MSTSSIELNDILSMEQQDEWLYNVKEMRDYSTHRDNIPRTFYEGGPNHGEVHLKNPATGKTITQMYHI